MMQLRSYEETFIHPGTHLLTRRFQQQPIVTLDQSTGEVNIYLKDLPARTTSSDVLEIVNRALDDFNLPGTLHYSGKGLFTLNWIKCWNWINIPAGTNLMVNIHDNIGPDPLAEAMGIHEPNNDYEEEAVPLVLTREDWAEIYYALEYKRDFNPAVDGDQEWIGHLNKILEAIGPDGDIAAASGVEANG